MSRQADAMQGIAYRRCSLLLCAVLVAAGSARAEAQPVPKVENLTVAIWPEYDRPAALITCRLQLSADTPLPTRVPVPIPSEVGEPHAVAKRGADGRLYLAPHTREVAGEWATLTVMTDSPIIQVEYYAALPLDVHMRDFTFSWPGGLEIAHFAYEVLEPTGASEFRVTPPPLAAPVRDARGFMTYRGDLGPRSSTEGVEIAISYHKKGSQLSTAPSPARAETRRPPPPARSPAAEPPPLARSPAAESPPDDNSSRIVLFVFVGAAVVLAGLWLASRKTPESDGTSSDGDS